MDVSQHLDLTMSEFWARYTYGSNATVELAASAAHTSRQPVAASEAFTGAPLTSRWTGHPYAFKAEGDRMFTKGINRFVFHTFVHQPHPTAKPGMTMGPFGTHFDRNTTWMDRDTGWIQYISRSQNVLQSGLPVVDVAYVKSEEPVSGVPDARAAIPEGYAVDVVSPRSLERAAVKQGRLMLASGASYACLVLQPHSVCTVLLLRNLLRLVKDGACLVTSAIPSAYASLQVASEAEHEFAQLKHQLWADMKDLGSEGRRCGAGTIFLTDALELVLRSLSLTPDLAWTARSGRGDLLWTHRRIGRDDVYFVSNQQRRKEDFEISFRHRGARVELWDAEHGTRSLATAVRVVNDRTQLQLCLEPTSSVFVVFRNDRTMQPDCRALPNTSGNPPQTNPEPFINDFTLSVWAEPETYALPGSSFLAYPGPGATLYGAGHAVAGLTAGQNGVRVYERGTGGPKLVLDAKHPLSGWSHLALLYRAGAPTIVIDGEIIATALPSGLIIHPPQPVTFHGESSPRYFEGNASDIVVTAPRTLKEIQSEVRAGPPSPSLPQSLTIERSLSGKVAATAWTPGIYNVSVAGIHRPIRLPRSPLARTLGCEWLLTFPPGSGAPESVHLDALLPLNLHDDGGVRHFAGTVSYRTSFHLDNDDLAPGAALVLDLGRVNVIARVFINGKAAGSLWKPPFRLPLHGLIHLGANDLQIEVITLWPNRLIGDESLTLENEYDAHGPIRSLPEWYVRGETKPGQRVTFSTWHSYNATDPLLDSGLLGPVVLLRGVEVEL